MTTGLTPPNQLRDDTPAAPDDATIARNAWFYRESYVILHEGLKKLRERLFRYKSDLEHCRSNFDLSDSRFEQTREDVNDAIESVDLIIEWGEQALSDTAKTIIDPKPSYGALRLLKAGGILEAIVLEQSREDFINRTPRAARKIVELIDDKIRIVKNVTETGALNGLSPAQVFLDTDDMVGVRELAELKAIDQAGAPTRNIVIESNDLPILDEDLRTRCLGILRDIVRQGDETRLDTVVREMSAVLENRIRDVAGITEKLSGLALATAAFAGGSPKLIFSADAAVQEAAHLLFRGFIGFYRNETMHRLVKTFTRDRVYQLLGYVDELLFLLTQAQKPAAVPPTGTSS